MSMYVCLQCGVKLLICYRFSQLKATFKNEVLACIRWLCHPPSPYSMGTFAAVALLISMSGSQSSDWRSVSCDLGAFWALLGKIRKSKKVLVGSSSSMWRLQTSRKGASCTVLSAVRHGSMCHWHTRMQPICWTSLPDHKFKRQAGRRKTSPGSNSRIPAWRLRQIASRPHFWCMSTCE